MKVYYSGLILLFLGYSFAFGSEKEIEKDSVRMYKLGEIICLANKLDKNTLPTKISNISYTQIRKSDPVSLTNLVSLLPSTHYQTNSRGEALVYMRGIGDRRTGVFFDGILMNIPWDRRFSMSMIPVDIIGNISASNGSASILYGSNTMAGVIDIATMEQDEEGYSTNIKTRLGTAENMNFSITNEGRKGNFNYIANLSYASSNGDILTESIYDKANTAGDLSLVNQNDNSYIRTNSDFQRFTTYLRSEYRMDNSVFGLSYMHINGEQGVTPVAYESSTTRFWKYPKYDRNILAFNFVQNFDSSKCANNNLKITLWYDKFGQKIDEYSDISYNQIESNTNDDVSTIGSRLVFNYEPFFEHSLTAVISAYYLENTETIETMEETNVLQDIQDYSEFLADGGIEYRIKLLDDFVVSAGALFSLKNNPQTGKYFEMENSSTNNFSGVLGCKYLINSESSIFANVSRKVAYPSLRESFANPIKKFVTNPDLHAENGILSEIGFEIDKQNWTLSSAMFYNNYNDLLIKKRDASDELNRYIRLNLADSYFYGFETSLFFYIGNFSFRQNISYVYSQGRDATGDKWQNLEYVPLYLSYSSISYKISSNINLQYELDFIGEQYGSNAEDIMKINGSIIQNLRIGWQPPITFAGTELYLRINNLADSERIREIGLPEAGRTIFMGCSLSF